MNVISDPFRVPITAESREDGGVVLRGHFRSVLALSSAELQRLQDFADSPRLGKLQRFPCRPDTADGPLQAP